MRMPAVNFKKKIKKILPLIFNIKSRYIQRETGDVTNFFALMIES